MQPNPAIDNLMSAMQVAEKISPKENSLPYLAETLKRAGVLSNSWWLPSCQSLFVTELGAVMMPGENLEAEMTEVVQFDEAALKEAIEEDQAGKIDTREFLGRIWKAGVVWYRLDFNARTVTYHGLEESHYVDSYPAVDAEAALAPW